RRYAPGRAGPDPRAGTGCPRRPHRTGGPALRRHQHGAGPHGGPRLTMPTTLRMPSTEAGCVPWNDACQALAASIGRELGRIRDAGGADCQVAVAPLGVRDELASADPAPDACACTVPVFLAGRIAIVGPFRPAAHRDAG